MDITTLHLFSLILTAPVIIYADHMGFMYLTGRAQTLSAQKVVWIHRLVTLGILLLIITGVWITIPRWQFLFQEPLFYTKLAFVVALFINGLFIGKLMHKATTTPFALLSTDEKRVLILSGAVSGISWVATVLIAFFGL